LTADNEERVKITRAGTGGGSAWFDAFLVTPGHEIPSIEQAVKRTDDYLIVVKIHPETTRIARARSQRAHS
jgi:cobalamin-dependent methionine synthase I